MVRFVRERVPAQACGHDDDDDDDNDEEEQNVGGESHVAITTSACAACFSLSRVADEASRPCCYYSFVTRPTTTMVR